MPLRKLSFSITTYIFHFLHFDPFFSPIVANIQPDIRNMDGDRIQCVFWLDMKQNKMRAKTRLHSY